MFEILFRRKKQQQQTIHTELYCEITLCFFLLEVQMNKKKFTSPVNYFQSVRSSAAYEIRFIKILLNVCDFWIVI